MHWLVSPFTDNEFMARALLAGVLVSLLCAATGTYVVLRGLSFIGDALAHGVLPGVATALLIGVPGILGAAVGSVVMIGGVSLVTKRTKLSSDAAIGLLFVGMLALGVMIVSRSDSFSGDIVHILFGEILGVGAPDLWLLAVSATVVVTIASLFSRPFLLLCFDPEQADVAGFRSSRYHLVMLAMVAGTVIVSFQAVGTLLVFGMLLAPAGAGALLARQVRSMMLWAAGIGSFSVYAGLLVSYHYDLAASATIVFVAVIVFFLVLIVTMLRERT
ncbi:MAG: metal ABC transporter permease [Acidimicrobiia bacterium]